MIEPYATIVKLEAGHLAQLGFRECADSDYSVIYSNGSCSLEIATEKYYHPSLTTKLIDKDGKTFSIRILREILDPLQLARDSAALTALKIRFQLDDMTIDSSARTAGNIEYLKLATRQLLAFLDKCKDELLSENDYLRVEYARKERDVLNRIGI